MLLLLSKGYCFSHPKDALCAPGHGSQVCAASGLFLILGIPVFLTSQAWLIEGWSMKDHWAGVFPG